MRMRTLARHRLDGDGWARPYPLSPFSPVFYASGGRRRTGRHRLSQPGSAGELIGSSTSVLASSRSRQTASPAASPEPCRLQR